ncbi:hypothetical protein FKM82_019031 [Ascaphus truei]
MAAVGCRQEPAQQCLLLDRPIILSSTVIMSEWRRFSASTIFPSEATIASYVEVDGRFGGTTVSIGTSSWSHDCISVSSAASSSSYSSSSSP